MHIISCHALSLVIFTPRAGCTTDYHFSHTEPQWQRSVVVSGVGLINEVNQHWARLVLGWVTICGWVKHLGM